MGFRETDGAPIRRLIDQRNPWTATATETAVDSADTDRSLAHADSRFPDASRFTADTQFTVVDVETTGLDPASSRVIQLAAVRIGWGGDVVDSFDTIVRPENPDLYEHGAEHIHGITPDQVAGGMPVGEALLRLRETLDGSVLTGHNVRFDIGFLSAEAARTGVSLPMTSWVDTLWLARELDPDKTHSHRLSALCERFGISVTRAHDALADAVATANLLMILLPRHGIESPADLHRIVRTGSV